MSTPITTEVSRPRSSQHVSISWDDEPDAGGHMETSQTGQQHNEHAARLQYEIAECVETKTITTTTTTKRAYPPVYVRTRRPLKSLDTKEYPLAGRATPAELSKFSFDFGVERAQEQLDRLQERASTQSREQAAQAAQSDRLRESMRSETDPWNTSFDSTRSQPMFDYSQEDVTSASASIVNSPSYRSGRRGHISTVANTHGESQRCGKAEPGIDSSPLAPRHPSFQQHTSHSQNTQESDATVLRRPTRSNSNVGSPVSAATRKIFRSASHAQPQTSSGAALATANEQPRRPASSHVRDERDAHPYLATPENSHIHNAQSATRKGSLRQRTLRSERAATCATAAPLSVNAAAGPAVKEEVDDAIQPNSATSTEYASGPDSVMPLYDTTSPGGGDSHSAFSAIATTPPIIDQEPVDAENADPDESLQQTVRALPPRILGNHDASLPSPRLSPTLSAMHPAGNLNDDDDDDLDEPAFSQQALMQRPRGTWMESQSTEDGDLMFSRTGRDIFASDLGRSSRALASASGTLSAGSCLDDVDTLKPSLTDVQTMLERFDDMPNEMKTFMMYQFLRRCPRKTLQMVSDVVTPALKCDFIKQLPIELCLHILSYLDFRDMCRAAQVSKHWRLILDSNETGWKELFDRDGFVLPVGELQRAVRQGWGWQDPVGAEGCELDLSRNTRFSAPERELRANCVIESGGSPQPVRSSLRVKRKRLTAQGSSSTERSKRHVSAQDAPSASKNSKVLPWPATHKSEGPISAASAAAAAVPDPQVGLQSLRNLHLFKSLYRRHFMIRQNWTSGKVKPSHVAFAAHPRHVITCLQFDDDKIITGSDDTLIHIYDTKSGRLMKKLEGHEGGVWALQYEGNVLVSGSTDRSVRVWDIDKGICTQVFYGHTSTVRCLQILMPTPVPGKFEDGKEAMMPPKPLIITGSRDNQLRVWRLPEPGSMHYIQSGPPDNDDECPYFIRILAGHTSSVRSIAAHGDTLVSGSYDSTVRVWRISTGESRHVLHGHAQRVYSVVLDTKRNRCISGSMDSMVKIWDLESGSCLYTLEGHSLLVGLLDLRDEKLVSAAADSTLRVWDPESGRCKSTLTAHTGAITCFQHDGRKVISGSEKTVKMWDIQTGECIMDMLSDLGGVWQVKFDGRRCVAAVQRDNLTYVEILDFGAVRDGVPVEELGQRRLISVPDKEDD